MNISKNIKKILIDENLTQTKKKKKLGTSQQNLNSKLKRDNFSNREMLEIANALGYELKIEFIKK